VARRSAALAASTLYFTCQISKQVHAAFEPIRITAYSWSMDVELAELIEMLRQQRVELDDAIEGSHKTITQSRQLLWRLKLPFRVGRFDPKPPKLTVSHLFLIKK